MNKIAVLFPSDDEKAYLQTSIHAKQCRFHFIGNEDTPYTARFDAQAFFEKTLTELQRLGIDGIFSTDDYPGSPMAAMMADALGLPTPSVKSVLTIQHKYHSRIAQRTALPRETPSFCAVNLEEEPDWGAMPEFPLFLKPVKSYLSYLSKTIRNKKELRDHLRQSKNDLLFLERNFINLCKIEHCEQFGEFNWLQYIAEERIFGRQVNLDGFVHRGKVHVLGIVDSIRYPNKFSFKRFQYPAKIPDPIAAKMTRMTGRIIEEIGFDNSLFNIEFFYDCVTGRCQVIEINSRMANQFASLYQDVEGLNLYDIAVALALGEKPTVISGQGKYSLAASMVSRTFRDQHVLSIPSPGQIERVKRQVGSSSIQVLAEPGKSLSWFFQDGRSYRYLIANLGANNQSDLERKHATVVKMLPVQFR